MLEVADSLIKADGYNRLLDYHVRQALELSTAMMSNR